MIVIHMRRGLLVAALLLGSAGWSHAQDAAAPPAAEPSATTPPAEEKIAPAKPRLTDEQRKLREERATARKRRQADTSAKQDATTKSTKPGSEPLVLTPDAKFVCMAPLQESPPVWRGDASLTWTFSIKNDGTAPLEIRAKGG